MTHTISALVSPFQDNLGAPAPDLIDRLRAHDEAAFEELVREHGPRMLAVATRYLHRVADAEDAVQEAFVNVVRSIAGFQRASSLGTWLHRIVVNCSLMILRRQRRKPETALEGSALEGGAFLPRRSPPPLSAHVTLEAEERARLVRTCVELLPEAQRSVIMLRDIQQLGFKAIGELLDIGVSTVKLRLRVARHTLHRALSPNPLLKPKRHRPATFRAGPRLPSLAV